MSSSPMTAAKLHDNLVLLDGGKRWPVPGAARVKVELKANSDTQTLPAQGNEVTQLHEATADVEVEVVMWKAAQWDQYQHLLAHLRRGRKDGPAVFTSAHPELAARKVKRLYFVSESGGEYSPKGVYKVTLKFSEKLKEKDKAQALGDTPLVIPGQGGSGTGAPGNWGSGQTTATGQAVADAMLRSLAAPPVRVGNNGETTATPGFCSASVRVAATAAGMPREMFGNSALATEANANRMGLGRPWQPGVTQIGDQIAFAKDPSGYGHIGTVVGFDKKDGMPLIAGNNLATYVQKGGRFDSAGRPIDRNIDSRGIVRLDQLTTPKSQPTSIIRPGGWASPAKPAPIGPVAPIPTGMPSQNVQPPK